ncbi:amino acid adenylation domain-containing protein [Streptomyces sp. NPDC017248]|uniref:amino acid adenylation domain-containing protein n=1 Tax=unclassified Streptomyces TaxID=2593676 RepID=UPI0037B6F2BE
MTSSSTCLHHRFEEVVRQGPARVAVTAPDGRLSYAELNARAGELAARLRTLGVGPDVPVVLFADRSTELLIGLLGILKAGGGYVPVDPDYPAERVTLLLRESGARAVVTAAKTADLLPPVDCPVVVAGAPGDESDRAPAAAPATTSSRGGDLAYVIHTSGSTGVPKGVAVEHRNVLRLFEQTASTYGFGPDDVWTLFHSASFDFSVWEMWGALLHGGRLVVVPSEVARSPREFRALLADEGVTVLNQTPSAFRQLTLVDEEEDGLDDLRLVVFGGERLDPALLRPWFARYGQRGPRLVNMYGITETTVHVTHHTLTEADLELNASPIGVPLDDLIVRLLDSSGAPVLDGEPGEVHVFGPGVARGYVNRPDLTAERFLEINGERCYRSGDLARRTAGGELLYLGRIDAQLKVRGFRIEPGEVEAALAVHPKVTQAVVVAEDHGDGDARLAAYLLAAGDAPHGFGPRAAAALTEEVAELARRTLPAHLRPSAYRLVPSLPLTPEGKTDRSAVAALALPWHAPAEEPDDTAPRVPERVVRDIAQEVLGREVPDSDTDLFDIGATSLAFVRILHAVNQHFGITVNVTDLGGVASVRQLAICVDSATTQSMGA